MSGPLMPGVISTALSTSEGLCCVSALKCCLCSYFLSLFAPDTICCILASLEAELRCLRCRVGVMLLRSEFPSAPLQLSNLCSVISKSYSLNEGTPSTCLRLNTGTRKWDGCPKFQEQFHVGTLPVSQSFVSWLNLTHVGCVFCDSAAKVNCLSIGQCLRLVRDMNSTGGEARVLGLISWDCPRVLSMVAGD